MGQPLILVHGTRFDSRQWSGYAERLPDADVVTVDLPGHGDRVGEPWTDEAAVDVVARAVEATGRADAVLAGHSLGGYVATTYAQRHPDRIGALVLLGATADPSRHPALRRTYTGFARALTAVGPDRMAVATNAMLRRLGAAPEDVPGTAGYAALPAAWAGTMASASAEQLRGLPCPVFLVGGQFDQLRIDARHYASMCADARIRVIPRASHLAPLTHRDEVAAVLREALAAARSPS